MGKHAFKEEKMLSSLTSISIYFLFQQRREFSGWDKLDFLGQGELGRIHESPDIEGHWR